MAKNPTPWSNNDIKPTTSWTRATKGTTAWANNVAKNITVFTGLVKNLVTWQNNSVTQTPYLYNDPALTYNSAVRSYNYLNPQSNQLNGKNPTAWSPN